MYRYGENGSKVKALDHPLYRLLHDEPNPEMTSFNFRETLMGHLLLYGNAYAQIIRNGKGEVIGLYPLMPTKMTVDRDSKGQIYYLYTRGSDDSPVDDENGQVYLPPEQVLHIPGLGYDGIVGYSPMLWQRTRWEWRLPARSTVRSFSPTMQPPAVCWNIPAF